MEDTILENLTVEQKVMKATQLIIQSAEFMNLAGFTDTSEQLLRFALEVATSMENEMKMIEQYQSKLTDNEFDDILANILSIEIEAPIGN